ncbi:MarR family winged helix-turn-helix transcriptional regulator [Sphingomonas jatrophae]|nr:MarR family winged helix-turn-helix transcriptional regulator [Sphingomonas jatrophae]
MAKRALILDEFLPYRLSFTSNLVSEAVAGAYMALFDLRIPEWRVIAVAAEHDGISQQEIGLATRMDKVTVSRAAIALTARGLLLKRPHPGDKRSHRLSLSAAGRALYAQVAPKALELEERIFAALPEGELDAFVATLRKIDAVVLRWDEDALTAPTAPAD